MPDKHAYDATSLDPDRLRAYARRVADARRQLGESGPWSLDVRHWSRTMYSKDLEDTSEARFYYRVQPDGKLEVETVQWEEYLHRQYGWGERERTTERREFGEHDMLLFDFERRDLQTRSKELKIDSSRDVGTRLMVHAKGDGLSLRLKKLGDTGH